MSDSVMIRHCAPMLAGLKTAHLFRCSFRDTENAKQTLRQWNMLLSPKGIRFFPMTEKGGRVLIYAYRPKWLQRDLCHGCALQVLDEIGYPCGCVPLCLSKLARKIREDAEFPNEIGFFLGYPPEDVRGFMEGHPCIFTGFWRVYSDEETKKELFCRYRQCTREYCALHAQGIPLEQLAVPS